MFGMKREAKEDTETPFMKNGRMLLEELTAFCDGERNLILVFSAEELRRATHNCNPLQIFWMQMVFTFTRVLWKITYFQLKSMAKDHGLYWRDDQRHCHWITNECPPKCSVWFSLQFFFFFLMITEHVISQNC